MRYICRRGVVQYGGLFFRSRRLEHHPFSASLNANNMRLDYTLLATIWIYGPIPVAATNFKQRCLQFQPQTIMKNSQLTRLEYLASGTSAVFPDNDPSCNSYKQKVETDLCRIGLVIKTSKRSEISLELWLPEQWAGKRLLSTGNGGIDGCKMAGLHFWAQHLF